MGTRTFALIFGIASAAFLAAGCSLNDASAAADDDAAASMADAEGGSAAIIANTVAAMSQGGAGKALPAAASRDIVWSGTISPSVAFTDDSGNPVAAAVATKATVAWTRSSTFSSRRASGSAVAVASLSFSGLRTATWTMTGTITIDRNARATRTGDATVSHIVHSFDLTLNNPASDPAYAISGGTASTTGTFALNGGSSLQRDYSWTFHGDGTATLQRGSGNASVQVEGAS